MKQGEEENLLEERVGIKEDWDTLRTPPQRAKRLIQLGKPSANNSTSKEDPYPCTSSPAIEKIGRDIDLVSPPARLIRDSSTEDQPPVVSKVLSESTSPSTDLDTTADISEREAQMGLHQHIQPAHGFSKRLCDLRDQRSDCDIASGSTEDVHCSGPSSGPPCPQKLFSRNYLDTYCGIQLSDVRQTLESRGYWLCPTCSYREGKLRETRGPSLSAVTRLPTKFGRDRLSDQEVCQPWDRLDSLLLGYSLMARNKPSLPAMQFALQDLPIIENESGPETQVLVEIFRLLLDVPIGVSIKAQAVDLQLQDLEPLDMIRGVLARLLTKAVLQSESPFEDAEIWRESLTHSKPAEMNLLTETNFA
jgi:hypothetical protein